jgi:hypothetical protein
MAPEVKILASFPDCPQCGSTETVAGEALKPLIAKNKFPPDVFAQLEQKVVPLEQPLFAGVTVPCLVTRYDVCFKCGTPRCTRAEIVNAPIQAQVPPPGNNGGLRRN